MEPVWEAGEFRDGIEDEGCGSVHQRRVLASNDGSIGKLDCRPAEDAFVAAALSSRLFGGFAGRGR